MLQNAARLGTSARWPMKMSLVLRLPCDMHLCRSSSLLPSFLQLPQDPHIRLTFGKVQNPLRVPRKMMVETSKSGPSAVCFYIYIVHNFTLKRASRHSRVHFLNRSTPKSSEVVFGILTSRCASRHRSVHFFNSSTSKSARNLKCF